MVHWYHAVFSAYGFWLPNDPRGSWSTYVGSRALIYHGSATKTDERRSLAHDAHDVRKRREAKQALKFPPVRFDGRQRDAIARGIAQACEESAVIIHACAIGYDHIHVIVARHAKPIERVIGQFKGRATQQMTARACHPMARFAASAKSPPTPWGEGCWKVFIDSDTQLASAIHYVEEHPVKEGMAAQRFDFVRPV